MVEGKGSRVQEYGAGERQKLRAQLFGNELGSLKVER